MILKCENKIACIIDFFILSTAVDYLAASRPNIGKKTKLWAYYCISVEWEKIKTGRETLIIDFPQRIFMPIFLIMKDITFPYLLITSASVNIKHSFGSGVNPLSLILLSHSSRVYFSPFSLPSGSYMIEEFALCLSITSSFGESTFSRSKYSSIESSSSFASYISLGLSW